MAVQAQAQIVVVGAGFAGGTFIKEFRRQNKETSILWIMADEGELYSKPQLSLALTQQKTPDQLVIKQVGQMAADLGVSVMTCTRVTALDPEQHKLWVTDRHNTTQQEINYSQLVLALGAAPRQIAEMPEPHLSVNHLSDYRRFRAALPLHAYVAIVGSGLVGCEFAYDLARSGHAVRLWGGHAQMLHNLLPAQAATAVTKAMIAAGVQYCDSDRLGMTNFIQQANDDQALILSALGIIPCVELAKPANLAINRGILVNHQLQTSAPDIYAIGDCAEVEGKLYQYIQPIQAQARILACTLSQLYPAQLEQSVEKMVQPLPGWRDECWPINVKVPGQPLVVPSSVPGRWHLEGADLDWRGWCLDQDSRVSGLLLMGQRVRERAQAMAQLKHILKPDLIGSP